MECPQIKGAIEHIFNKCLNTVFSQMVFSRVLFSDSKFWEETVPGLKCAEDSKSNFRT